MGRDNAKTNKIVKIALSCAVAVGVTASVIGAIFSGGELTPEGPSSQVKGVIRITEGDYATSYLSGEKFSFDKENSTVMLVAKDPAIENIVKIEDLPGSEYGFMVNGEGQIYFDPSEITVDDSVKKVDLVSRVYPDLRTPINLSVVTVDESSLNNELLLEGEDANLYKDGKLLNDEALLNGATDGKSFLSDKGEDPRPAEEAERFSGGVCLRNFQKSNMKIEYEVVATEETEVKLEVIVCQRKTAATFGDWYLPKLNGKEIKELSAIEIPAGSDFFTPYTVEVTVTLVRGVNVITFESGSTLERENPGNFDAIRLTCEKEVIGTIAEKSANG